MNRTQRLMVASILMWAVSFVVPAGHFLDLKSGLVLLWGWQAALFPTAIALNLTLLLAYFFYFSKKGRVWRLPLILLLLLLVYGNIGTLIVLNISNFFTPSWGFFLWVAAISMSLAIFILDGFLKRNHISTEQHERSLRDKHA